MRMYRVFFYTEGLLDSVIVKSNSIVNAIRLVPNGTAAEVIERKQLPI